MKGALSCRDCKHCIDVEKELSTHYLLRKWGKMTYAIDKFVNHEDVPIPNTAFECGLKSKWWAKDLDPVWHRVEVVIRMDYRYLNGKLGVGFCPFYKGKSWFRELREKLRDKKNKKLIALEGNV